MTLRTLLLPALLSTALFPVAAHAATDRGFGQECSYNELSISPTSDGHETTTVGAIWIVENTSIASMILHCEVWEGQAAFQAHQTPVHVYDVAESGAPVITMEQPETFSDAGDLVWCMDARAYTSAGSLGGRAQDLLPPGVLVAPVGLPA